ncbi:hypothetical protein [Candidatus Lokiarchaeum ossiferum]|uniref:hypothetical protein n=1 Tax=Candidatus Lokiarchaeum ossiferum TaxID=2951803 RepID=UPI00352C1E31
MVDIDPEISPSYDIKKEYKLSFDLFKDNFKPFFIVLLIGFVIYMALDHYLTKIILPDINWMDLKISRQLMLFIIYLPGDSIFFGFFGAAMGLGYDIMSSGDGFTEVRNSLYYIRKYWFKFFVFCFIFNIFSYWLLYLAVDHIPLNIYVSFKILNFFWIILFSNVFPALVHRKKLLIAMKENFEILSHSFGRVIFTYLPYYLIFTQIRTGVLIYQHYVIFDMEDLTTNIIKFCLTVFYVFIGFPIFAFLSLSMYNEEIRSQELDK